MNSAKLELLNDMTKGNLCETLGMKFISYDLDKVVMTMPVDHRTHQPLGLLHGGASVALAETVASMGGAMLVIDKGEVVVGQEINANHIKSIREGLVRGEACPLHVGRRSHVWEIKIYNDESNELLCISRCTLAVIKA